MDHSRLNRRYKVFAILLMITKMCMDRRPTIKDFLKHLMNFLIHFFSFPQRKLR